MSKLDIIEKSLENNPDINIVKKLCEIEFDDSWKNIKFPKTPLDFEHKIIYEIIPKKELSKNELGEFVKNLIPEVIPEERKFQDIDFLGRIGSSWDEIVDFAYQKYIEKFYLNPEIEKRDEFKKIFNIIKDYRRCSSLKLKLLNLLNKSEYKKRIDNIEKSLKKDYPREISMWIFRNRRIKEYIIPSTIEGIGKKLKLYEQSI